MTKKNKTKHLIRQSDKKFFAKMFRKLLYSGIQPTGKVHLGNYLGALKQWKHTDSSVQQVYCLVDLHAISTLRRTATPSDTVLLPKLHQETRSMCATIAACGVRGAVYVQSAVPAHAELHWILSCVARLGELERMTQFKSKAAAGKNSESPSLALLSYPVLMAADVLLFDAQYVPVGDDQRQHLELLVSLVQDFNRLSGSKVFRVPEPTYAQTARVLSLSDPSAKMSKSAELDRSRINLCDTADQIAAKVRRAVTDSEPGITHCRDTRPGVANLLEICAELTDQSVDEILNAWRLENSSQLKQRATECIVEHLRPIAARIADLEHPDNPHVDQVLADGAKFANQIATKNIENIKKRIGFHRPQS